MSGNLSYDDGSSGQTNATHDYYLTEEIAKNLSGIW